MSNIAPVAFESSWKKKEQKELLRKAREEYLEKAKAKYDHEQWKKEQARLRGEGTWMLTSVADRIDEENKEIEKVKAKKDKKHKKHKAKKQKKSRKDDSGASDSDKDDEMQWVEKSAPPEPHAVVKGPQLQRDDWMMAPADLFGGVTREQLRAEKNKDKEEERRKAALLEQPGMHKRELNPYWKDGGKGLPEEDVKKTSKPVVGDGGVTWLRKAYQRCKQQAEEEGRSMEEIAADRYGSLANLEAMIAEAEANQGKARRPAFRRPRSSSRERTTDRSGSMKRNRSRSRDRSRRSRSHSRDRRSRSHSRGRSRRSHSRGMEKDRAKSRSCSGDRARSKAHSRNNNKKSRSRSRERSRSRSRGRRSRSRDKKGSRSSSRERQRSTSHSRDSSSHGCDRGERKLGLKGLFKKPGELSERPSASSAGAWRKKEFQKPGEENREVSMKSQSPRSPVCKKPSRKDSTSDSLSSSNSESEPELPERKKKESSNLRASPTPVVLLSEDEMNKLAAKVMRAQIMGNDALAKDLQSKLDAAREARKAAPPEALTAAPTPGSSRSHKEEEVMLTRTDRSGMTRPVFDAKHPKEPSRGRRKKQKVATHDDGGERSRYFDDDDKYSLKDLVRREKMSTAEDQNSMFSRLAGKSFEKTDEDYDMDDVFMSRAARKQSDSKQEERDRSMAIFEHKKVSSSMEKCNRCMEKTPKHLIIAIGIKVYLCLPAHKSLAPGHCLIVPIHHVTAGTNVDEDVWTEIQVFRKGLTRMFQDRDEDVVFMETAMHLKHHPHMALEVVPLPNEVGHMAPIYFKKAIQETGEEWAQNKKLVDLSGKDVRKAIPKGFPYFSVDFGLQSGFAHVIEDEKTFPHWFGREIVGGMLEADPTMWRKPHKENFDDQRKKVLEFAAWWKPYDWTQRLKKPDTDSDDE